MRRLQPATLNSLEVLANSFKMIIDATTKPQPAGNPMNKVTIFESPFALENAQVMLDLCREEYERAGYGDVVQSLRGLDVTSLDTARVALLTVRDIPAYEGVADVRRYTIKALADAINSMKATMRLAG